MTTIRDLRRNAAEGLEIRCLGCGWIVITWWQTLRQPNSATLASITRRLRCERCGSRPGSHDVKPYSQSQSQPTFDQILGKPQKMP